MLNNDVLRRLRYILDFNDDQMVKIFALAELDVSRETVIDLLRKEDEVDYLKCNDVEFSTFLNGLIISSSYFKGDITK